MFKLLLILIALNNCIGMRAPVRNCAGDEEGYTCYNGGRCIEIDLDLNVTMRVCECRTGYTGRHCEFTTHEPCSPDPCLPNGYCNSNPGDGNGNGDDEQYICQCKPGYAGKNCEENVNDCLNARCENGGLCIDGINSYECECKWPYIGRYCETKMTCSLGGAHVDGVYFASSICKNNGHCYEDEETNEPACACQPGYTGVDCSIRVDVCSRLMPCQHASRCVNHGDSDYECKCARGFTGKNCEHVDYCHIDRPCKNNSTCINLVGQQFENTALKYTCNCSPGFTGINCDIKIKCTGYDCDKNAPWVRGKPRNRLEKISMKKLTAIPVIDEEISTTTIATTISSTTITIVTLIPSTLVQIEDSTAVSTSSATINDQPTNTTTVATDEAKTNNGSFVLVLNIHPNEFKRRKSEIISEFEHRFGILMLIKKEPDTKQDMIYPFYPSSGDSNKQSLINGKGSSSQVWTKVYFIIIFACVFDNSATSAVAPTNSPQGSLCLQNNVDNLNDVFGILNELKKASDLMPNYVSNISYEAFSDSFKRGDIHDSSSNVNKRSSADSTLTTVLSICLSISLLTGISLALTVLIRQQHAKRVKAPVWFPPISDEHYSQSGGDHKLGNNHNPYEKNVVFEMQKPKRLGSGETAPMPPNKQTSWSIGKTFDELSNIFFAKKGDTDSRSPPSSDHDYSEYTEICHKPPNKMRKIDHQQLYTNVNHSNSSSNPLITPSSQQQTATTPEYYPSPPESLPDASFNNQTTVNPVNYKGASYGLTPLMLYIMGRSKSKMNTNMNVKPANVESDLVDTFLSAGADLNTQNMDGETALHIAARCGLYEISERLIKNGAELNVYDAYGRNVLHTAVCSNEYQIVKLILNHCSMINQSLINSGAATMSSPILDDKYDLIDSKTNDDLGDTPLIMAARLNLNNIVQLLIDFNTTVNATDNEGRSALHWCAKVNNHAGALLLLQSGANVNMQDNDEKTPLSSALNELCTKDTADLLIKFDAFVSSEDEVKYNKMKSILDSLGAGQPEKKPSVDLLLTVKDNLMQSRRETISHFNQNTLNNNTNGTLQKLKSTKTSQASSTTVNNSQPVNSTGTKRKFSDTANNSATDKGTKTIANKKPNKNTDTKLQKTKSQIYTPLTPSPPPPPALNVNLLHSNFSSVQHFPQVNQYYDYKEAILNVDYQPPTTTNYYPTTTDTLNKTSNQDYVYSQQQPQQQKYVNYTQQYGYNYEMTTTTNSPTSNETSNGNANYGYITEANNKTTTYFSLNHAQPAQVENLSSYNNHHQYQQQQQQQQQQTNHQNSSNFSNLYFNPSISETYAAYF